jgi:hypothetical protein
LPAAAGGGDCALPASAALANSADTIPIFNVVFMIFCFFLFVIDDTKFCPNERTAGIYYGHKMVIFGHVRTGEGLLRPGELRLSPERIGAKPGRIA